MVYITNKSIQAEILRQQRSSSAVATEQTKIATGKKLTKASDSPQDWVQISEVGRQQSMTTSWLSNVAYAQSRAAQASTNLSDIDNLMTNASELMIRSTAYEAGSAGAEAIALSLEGILASITDLLNTKDYQGTPVFDDTTTVNVPVSEGQAVEAVPTRQSISDNVVGTKSLADVLTDAITAVRSGASADRTTALGEVQAAGTHVTVKQSEQGIRGERLDQIETRLTANKLELAERRSGLEDTDLTESVITMQNHLTTLEASQAAFIRVSQKTLFDYLG